MSRALCFRLIKNRLPVLIIWTEVPERESDSTQTNHPKPNLLKPKGGIRRICSIYRTTSSESLPSLPASTPTASPAASPRKASDEQAVLINYLPTSRRSGTHRQIKNNKSSAESSAEERTVRAGIWALGQFPGCSSEDSVVLTGKLRIAGNSNFEIQIHQFHRVSSIWPVSSRGFHLVSSSFI